MAVPNYSIGPVTEADHPTLITYLQASKLQLAINRFIFEDWPNESGQRENYTGMLALVLPLHFFFAVWTFADEGIRPFTGPLNPDETSLKIVNDETGEIVGHIVYTKTKTTRLTAAEKTEKAREAAAAVPKHVVPAVYSVMIHAVMDLAPEFEADEYIDLTHFYVEPKSRGKGIGEWLVKTAHDAAKDAGIPFTVCAEPNDHEFLVSCGFRDVKTADIDLVPFAAPMSGYGVFRLFRMIMSA
ncbi:hypothetical protein F5Y16DRAFT_422315 [Xylariaceae sp. FL0255]|nr:hypothetical protein F5Y16DRAFT_422315 [Xylariaceae sp. FL0255]